VALAWEPRITSVRIGPDVRCLASALGALHPVFWSEEEVCFELSLGLGFPSSLLAGVGAEVSDVCCTVFSLDSEEGAGAGADSPFGRASTGSGASAGRTFGEKSANVT
jgi:hypothetical protein